VTVFAGQPTIAVILPCHNEGKTIARVVEEFRGHLPSATIYVYDNNSSDDTAAEAMRAGAIVRQEAMQGKGFVVCRAFSQVEAEVYVLADGDGTYDAACAPEFVHRLWSEQLDMVVGVRRHVNKDAYRTGHRVGNKLFNLVVRWLFGAGFRDVFSGYRALSRPYVKSFPSVATGFEIEMEMSVHALQLFLPTAEVVTTYTKRTEGTESKLRTYRDGAAMLIAILRLLRHQRPLLMFGAIAIMLAFASVMLGLPIVLEFLETGLVPRLPSAVLAASLMVIAVTSFVTGIILDSVAHAAVEQKRLFYLSIPRHKSCAETCSALD
jgi:glycosyltransferase involved in cell wall biosynthesis